MPQHPLCSIYEKIGKGKHSTVYKGRKKKTIQYHAIKSVEKSQKPRVLQEVGCGGQGLHVAATGSRTQQQELLVNRLAVVVQRRGVGHVCSRTAWAPSFAKEGCSGSGSTGGRFIQAAWCNSRSS